MARRVVRNGHPRNDLLVSAHVDTNRNVFPRILDLYVADGSRVADVTYGRGAFWRDVRPGRYDVLATDLETGVDCCDLPYTDESIDCVVLDPPLYAFAGRKCPRWTRDVRAPLLEQPAKPHRKQIPRCRP